MTEVSEEQLQMQLENLMEQFGGFDISGISQMMPIITAVGIVLIALFYFWRWVSKKKKDKADSNLIAKYYEEYMNSDVEMDFQDYVFCRENGIKVKRPAKNNTGRIKTIVRTTPPVGSEVNEDGDNLREDDNREEEFSEED